MSHRATKIWRRIAPTLIAALAVVSWVGCDEQVVTPEPGETVFDLQLDLTGFTPHRDQRIEARVVDEATGEEVARTSVTGDTETTLFIANALMAGGTYRVDFYADLDGDDQYTPPVGSPVTGWPDHQWRLTAESEDVEGAAGLADVSDDVHLTMSHNANWVDIDWPGFEMNGGVSAFDLTLSLVSFAPHAGQRIEGRVIDLMTGEEVARADVIGDVEIDIVFEDALMEGGSYQLDFYADLDGNGEYTAPIGDPVTGWPDHQWRFTGDSTDDGASGLANVFGDVTITLPHNANWVDIDWPGAEENGGSAFDLTLSLVSFAPHAGQRIEGRVIDLATGDEVARADVIGDVEIDIVFEDALMEGGSYQLDFYADLDGNGEYTAPIGDPVTGWPDHQWRFTGDSADDGADGLADVSGDVTITLPHNANWVDIDWPGGEANQ